MPTPNAELLREMLEEIEFRFPYWDPKMIAARRQDSESYTGRDTSFGVEGHAINVRYPGAIWHSVPDQWEGHQFAVLVAVDGSRKSPGRNASFVARKLLGLDREQADRLFGAATIEDVRLVVAELCAGVS